MWILSCRLDGSKKQKTIRMSFLKKKKQREKASARFIYNIQEIFAILRFSFP